MWSVSDTKNLLFQLCFHSNWPHMELKNLIQVFVTNVDLVIFDLHKAIKLANTGHL